MFIDELFEKYLIEDGLTYEEAIHEVCIEKLNAHDSNFQSIRQIENGYQLFCKKHPECPKDMVRKYVKVYSPKLYTALGWDK